MFKGLSYAIDDLPRCFSLRKTIIKQSHQCGDPKSLHALQEFPLKMSAIYPRRKIIPTIVAHGEVVICRDLFHPEESVEHQTYGDPQEEISETN